MNKKKVIDLTDQKLSKKIQELILLIIRQSKIMECLLLRKLFQGWKKIWKNSRLKMKKNNLSNNDKVYRKNRKFL